MSSKQVGQNLTDHQVRYVVSGQHENQQKKNCYEKSEVYIVSGFAFDYQKSRKWNLSDKLSPNYNMWISIFNFNDCSNMKFLNSEKGKKSIAYLIFQNCLYSGEKH